MASRRNEQGQTLVELAFVFPIILLMLACMLQLVLVVRLHMMLHRSAVRMAAQLAMGQPTADLEASELVQYRHTLRWGVPIPSVHTETLSAWRKYKGIATTSETNCRAIAELSFPLTGSWFASVGLSPLVLHARASLPCEPSGMAEAS